jgi:hypothetical protein
MALPLGSACKAELSGVAKLVKETVKLPLLGDQPDL